MRPVKCTEVTQIKAKKQLVRNYFDYEYELKLQAVEICTEISLAPINIRLGEGNGSNKRPTP